ncbi:MAG: FAD/NAD(P)-binding protein [Deltaproteobacteria bacterium]|nr:FAD/NAD(P)-binding protein [Deltaproteobacteria bacterium]MBT4640157.1 FAD/NAD(P)-binding protein [Deltaproteobacteria bacterium]MBT6500692.1 FAD/NAD(P)-binding protein [Deltaproteobacteria bacterium]MBT6614235.1 FAD/NAD(P)-binding protein [Deltaproteobacteria bacterium]MBT7151788.1 FAD/NAD(P)-binding protein [Deltaproteobacteria bacterium]
MQNPYLPYPVRIDEIVTETEDRMLKTFKLVFLNPEDEEKFAYKAGQFAELSITGKGEVPIGIASSPTEKGFIKFTVNKTGLVTGFMHDMKVGDVMGVRGPLGNWYPWETLEGKNVVIVGGGFAFSTLRASIVYMLANRDKFKEINVIYGARAPELLLYKDELAEWEAAGDVKMHITVDGTDDPDWKYNVGFVPTIAEKFAPPADPDTYAIVCGPPAMIRFTQPVLDKLGYDHNNIINSLEKRMKCGIGICGRCNIGEKFVCKDGPVFTLDQLNNMPAE